MVESVYTTKTSVEEAVADVKSQISEANPKVIVYFASSAYDQAGVAKALKDAYPETCLIGCSTSGEIVSGKMLKNSMVAMALGSDVIEFADVEVIEDLSSKDSVDQVFARFESKLGTPVAELDITKYVGLIMLDGLSCAEEIINDRIGDLSDVLFIGGSAGDDLKFEKTWVHAEGQVYSGAAVVALLKTVNGFDILKTQSFDAKPCQLVPTKVDESTRTVYEFNDKPALDAYAEAIGASADAAADSFMHNPVGLMVGDEPYVRSPQQSQDGHMVFYCAVKEGMELSILESRDIVADTKKDLDARLAQTGAVKGIINFHCILRTLELENKGQTEAYGKLFTDVPTIGFSTYGETYIGHINQTSTMLILK